MTCKMIFQSMTPMRITPMKHRKQTPIVAPLTLLLGALLLSPFVARAADGKPPEVMSYQSFLVDAANVPLGNASPANYTIEFRIYDVSEGGSAIWGESQVVTVDKGYFNVLLGQGTALSGVNHAALSTLFSASKASDRYIGLTVSGVGSGELAPRLRLVGSPYAFLATHANSLATSGGASFLTYELDNSLSFKADVAGGSQLTLLPNGNLGVGRTAPAVALDVQGNARIINPSGSASLELYSFRNVGNQNKINAWAARGTEASPSALQAGDYTLELLGSSYTGVAGGYKNSARIAFGAESVPTSTSSPGYLSFQTTPSGSTSLSERMRITAAGNVGIRQSAPTFPLDVGYSGSLMARFQGAKGTQYFTDVATSGYSVNYETGASYVSVVNNSSGIGYRWSNAGGDLLTLEPNGNAGFGTTSPRGRLDVNGVAYVGDTANYWYSGQSTSGGYLEHSGNSAARSPFRIQAKHPTANAFSQFYVNPTKGFYFVTAGSGAGGNVGIGTASPGYPLDVQGGVSYDYGTSSDGDSFGFHNNLGTLTDFSGSGTVSIKAANFVAASGFTAVSDRRIKEALTVSDGEADLKAIEALRVTEYAMVDKIQQGNARRKGLIAQEVERVIPGAVSKGRGFVPDIYVPAEEHDYDTAAGRLSLRLKEAHGLKAGEMVRLFVGSASHDLKVAFVKDDRSFEVEAPEGDWSKVFVYGRQVDDFRSVDYDRVFVTAVSALQRLKMEKDAEVDTLLKVNSALEQKLVAQEKRLAELERKAEKRELQFIQFERLLRQRSGALQASLRN